MATLAIVFGLVSLPASMDTFAANWPPFLPARDGFSAELVEAVERTWAERTLSRTVRGPSVRAPLELYSALIDAPDVTAAAGRYRHYSADEVRLVGEDLYQADDHNGSRGFYRVLARERDRRVIFSWGENSGSMLGTIRGDALTIITLEPGESAVDQTVTAYVRIDNRLVAALARALLVPFGRLADRKLSEGVRLATRIADWAVTGPAEFCGWLGRSGIALERRAPIESLVPGCQDGRTVVPTSAR